MENENKSSQVKTKKITTGLVFAWVLGIVLGIVGITSMSKNVITGFLFIISFVIVFPPTYNLIKNKFKWLSKKSVSLISSVFRSSSEIFSSNNDLIYFIL